MSASGVQRVRGNRGILSKSIKKVSRRLSIMAERFGNDWVTWEMLEKGAADRSLQANIDPQVLRRITSAYKKAKEHQKEVSEVYKGGGEWKDVEKVRKRITDSISRDNVPVLEKF